MVLPAVRIELLSLPISGYYGFFLLEPSIQLSSIWIFSVVLMDLVILNRYGDIAECGFAAAERSSPMKVDPLRHKEMSTLQYTGRVGRRAGLGGVMIGIGELVYPILLSTIFFIGIFATGFVPYLGKAINFLLLSWIYAYYCFKYKWNHSEIDLDRRLNLFEFNWAFFAGFGSSCVLPVLFFSPLVTYGIMAILFPLFFWRQLIQRPREFSLLKEQNGETQNWEGFQYFTQLILYYCASCCFCRLNPGNNRKTLRQR